MKNKQGFPWKFDLSPLAREFQIFKAIYRAQSLSKASENLGQDQGNISRALKNLEEQMEVRLFVRHRNGVKPTNSADVLFTTLEELEKTWDLAVKGAFNDETSQTIKIEAHKTIAQTYLPSIFTALKNQIPNSYFEVKLETSYEVTQRVMERELDLGIVVNPIKSHDMIIRPFAKEQIELCGLNTSQKEVTLIRNPQMIYIEKLMKRTAFRRVIDVQDYDVAASICDKDPSYWTVIPSTVRERFPSLHVIRSLKNEINVKFITYPGSPLAGKLSSLVKEVKELNNLA